MTRNTKIAIGITLSALIIGGIVYFIVKKKKKKKVTAKDILDVAKNNSVDVLNTNAYKYIQKELKSVEKLLNYYKTTNTTLADKKTNKNISVKAEETLYLMITKNWKTIKDGISNDGSLTPKQKALLMEMYNDYFESYLPTWFDKKKYNINQKWYQDVVSKMTLLNLYE